MNDTDAAPWPLSETAAQQINRLRKRAGLNREQLAKKCRDHGAPATMTAAAIANIETGRRNPETGQRRRDITVEELVIFAYALDVPPVILVIPVGQHELSEVLPNRVVTSWTAAQWFTGESALPTRRGENDVHITAEDYDAWIKGSAPLDYYRQQDQLYRRWRDADKDVRPRLEEEFRELRTTMRRAGVKLRPLPPQLTHLEAQEGGEDARDQEDRPE